MIKLISEAVTPADIKKPDTSNPPSQPEKLDGGSPATPVQAKVDKIVKESPDLITALEMVGAEYGIPSTNFYESDDVDTIQVVDDKVIAPPMKNPRNQTKPIIQAIGAVLDFISQRIDDKLNDYQMKNITDGRLNDRLNTVDPVKGKCVGIFNDDNGDEIVAYSSGLVDMNRTPEAYSKLQELRDTKRIPTFDPTINDRQAGDEYFNDNDDVASNIDDLEASGSDPIDTIEENDIADQIQESAYHINMMAKLGDTTHLGYDLLRRHGFDFVKPIDSVVMETDEVEDDTPSKPRVETGDIKHIKFDNKGIISAIKYFNEARADQNNIKEGNIDIEAFINNPNYEKAIDGLNKQFNCRINLRFVKDKSGVSTAGTSVINDLKKKMTISKSKGFQLGGLPIEIIVWNHFLEEHNGNSKMFGQTMVSVILHEIFHNIAAVMRSSAVKDNITAAVTMNMAAAAKSPEEKRIIITKYVDALDLEYGGKLLTKAVKRKIIKQLTTLSAIGDNQKVIEQMKKKHNDKNPDKFIEDLIKTYKKSIKTQKRYQNTPKIFNCLGTALGALGIIFGASMGPMGAGIAVMSGAVFGVSLASGITYSLALHASNKIYSEAQLYEEYYCDLFAGMYKLPVSFFIGDFKKKYVANDFDEKSLSKLAELEKEYYKLIKSTYPTVLERDRASVKIAKKLLEDEDLEEPMRKYCQWVVDNYSKLEKTDIDKSYNKTTYDPKEAENLDKHLEDLINDNNIALTESYVQWMNSDEIF